MYNSYIRRASCRVRFYERNRSQGGSGPLGTPTICVPPQALWLMGLGQRVLLRLIQFEPLHWRRGLLFPSITYPRELPGLVYRVLFLIWLLEIETPLSSCQSDRLPIGLLLWTGVVGCPASTYLENVHVGFPPGSIFSYFWDYLGCSLDGSLELKVKYHHSGD